MILKMIAYLLSDEKVSNLPFGFCEGMEAYKEDEFQLVKTAIILSYILQP
jgi:hypothetical protein